MHIITPLLNVSLSFYIYIIVALDDATQKQFKKAPHYLNLLLESSRFPRNDLNEREFTTWLTPMVSWQPPFKISPLQSVTLNQLHLPPQPEHHVLTSSRDAMHLIYQPGLILLRTKLCPNPLTKYGVDISTNSPTSSLIFNFEQTR